LNDPSAIFGHASGDVRSNTDADFRKHDPLEVVADVNVEMVVSNTTDFAARRLLG